MKNRFGFIRNKWLQILVGGIILFIATEQALKITGIPNLIPTVLLLGAFVVPLTLVAYFYSQEHIIDQAIHQEQSPLAAIATCFLIGGILGVAAAATLEYATLQTAGFLGLLGVGFIEEIAKLILPVIIFIRGKYKSEADGLVFGVASGMGFAALETMGYGLTALLQSQGNIGVLEEVLLIRGLLSPAGHAAWTGYVCAVLWREWNRKGKKVVNGKVVGAFILAVALHSLWDMVNIIGGQTNIPSLVVIIGNLIIAAVSLTLLFRRLHESRRLTAEHP